MSQPVPRQKVFDAYWRFASERLAIMMRRIEGRPAPWTADPILREYKFCNTFRASDRVSQYMIRQLYADPVATKADLVFRAVAMRIFSRPATWDGLTQALGHQPRIGDLQDGGFRTAIDQLADRQTIYTGAFLLPSPSGAYQSDRKHLAHAMLFHDLFVVKEGGDRIAGATSLEEVFRILRGFDMMGDFLAYQSAIDINYSTATDFSENDFTVPGPGAIRGLAKVFEDLAGLSPSEAIQWMVSNQEEQFKRLGLDFPGLWGRPLQAIDCQGLFCETDKYSRVAFPELTSERIQIKAKFNKPHPEPFTLFFPPKWGINDRLPGRPVLGVRSSQKTLLGA